MGGWAGRVCTPVARKAGPCSDPRALEPPRLHCTPRRTPRPALTPSHRTPGEAFALPLTKRPQVPAEGSGERTWEKGRVSGLQEQGPGATTSPGGAGRGPARRAVHRAARRARPSSSGGPRLGPRSAPRPGTQTPGSAPAPSRGTRGPGAHLAAARRRLTLDALSETAQSLGRPLTEAQSRLLLSPFRPHGPGKLLSTARPNRTEAGQAKPPHQGGGGNRGSRVAARHMAGAGYGLTAPSPSL